MECERATINLRPARSLTTSSFRSLVSPDSLSLSSSHTSLSPSLFFSNFLEVRFLWLFTI